MTVHDKNEQKQYKDYFEVTDYLETDNLDFTYRKTVVTEESIFKQENSNLIAINRVLVKEQKDLKAELEVERSTLKTWTNSSCKVSEILDSQIPDVQKAGIGYNNKFYNQIFQPISKEVQINTL